MWQTSCVQGWCNHFYARLLAEEGYAIGPQGTWVNVQNLEGSCGVCEWAPGTKGGIGWRYGKMWEGCHHVGLKCPLWTWAHVAAMQGPGAQTEGEP